MNVFRFLMIFLAITILQNSIVAQVKTTLKANKDAKAVKVLQGIKKEFDSVTTLEIKFNILMEMPDNTNQKQKGVMQKSGNQYYIDTDQFVIINNGKAIWFINKANKEGQINTVDSESGNNLFSPLEILKIYEKEDHNIAITNEYTEKGLSYQQIEFVPLDKSIDYSKVRLTLQKGSSKLSEIKFFYRDGSRMSLNNLIIVKNKAIPASQFVFQSSNFPGVYMEDLRN